MRNRTIPNRKPPVQTNQKMVLLQSLTKSEPRETYTQALQAHQYQQ